MKKKHSIETESLSALKALIGILVFLSLMNWLVGFVSFYSGECFLYVKVPSWEKKKKRTQLIISLFLR